MIVSSVTIVHSSTPVNTLFESMTSSNNDLTYETTVLESSASMTQEGDSTPINGLQYSTISQVRQTSSRIDDLILSSSDIIISKLSSSADKSIEPHESKMISSMEFLPPSLGHTTIFDDKSEFSTIPLEITRASEYVSTSVGERIDTSNTTYYSKFTDISLNPTITSVDITSNYSDVTFSTFDQKDSTSLITSMPVSATLPSLDKSSVQESQRTPTDDYSKILPTFTDKESIFSVTEDIATTAPNLDLRTQLMSSLLEESSAKESMQTSPEVLSVATSIFVSISTKIINTSNTNALEQSIISESVLDYKTVIVPSSSYQYFTDRVSASLSVEDNTTSTSVAYPITASSTSVDSLPIVNDTNIYPTNSWPQPESSGAVSSVRLTPALESTGTIYSTIHTDTVSELLTRTEDTASLYRLTSPPAIKDPSISSVLEMLPVSSAQNPIHEPSLVTSTDALILSATDAPHTESFLTIIDSTNGIYAAFSKTIVRPTSITTFTPSMHQSYKSPTEYKSSESEHLTGSIIESSEQSSSDRMEFSTKSSASLKETSMLTESRNTESIAYESVSTLESPTLAQPSTTTSTASLSSSSIMSSLYSTGSHISTSELAINTESSFVSSSIARFIVTSSTSMDGSSTSSLETSMPFVSTIKHSSPLSSASKMETSLAAAATTTKFSEATMVTVTESSEATIGITTGSLETTRIMTTASTNVIRTEFAETASVRTTEASEATSVTQTETSVATSVTTMVPEQESNAATTESLEVTSIATTESLDAPSVTPMETSVTASVTHIVPTPESSATTTESLEATNVTTTETSKTTSVTTTESSDTSSVTTTESSEATSVTTMETQEATSVTTMETSEATSITTTESSEATSVTKRESISSEVTSVTTMESSEATSVTTMETPEATSVTTTGSSEATSHTTMETPEATSVTTTESSGATNVTKTESSEATSVTTTESSGATSHTTMETPEATSITTTEMAEAPSVTTTEYTETTRFTTTDSSDVNNVTTMESLETARFTEAHSSTASSATTAEYTEETTSTAMESSTSTTTTSTSVATSTSPTGTTTLSASSNPTTETTTVKGMHFTGIVKVRVVRSLQYRHGKAMTCENGKANDLIHVCILSAR